MNERYILSSLNHPFLINIHSSFQDEFNLYLTMDYLRGADLRYHICYKEKFTEAEISSFFILFQSLLSPASLWAWSMFMRKVSFIVISSHRISCLKRPVTQGWLILELPKIRVQAICHWSFSRVALLGIWPLRYCARCLTRFRLIFLQLVS
jgi:hypothetical protein